MPVDVDSPDSLELKEEEVVPIAWRRCCLAPQRTKLHL